VPLDGATNVELEDIISATFNEKIAINSVDNTTFQLSQGGKPVTSTVILDSANNTAKLGTDKTLALLTEYTATLTGCITNLSGTPVPTTSWSFTSRDGVWETIGKSLDLGHTGPASTPHIAASANGNAVAVWVEDNGGRTDVWAKRYTPSLGWRNPELVETDITFSSTNPRVAMDDIGNAIVVWQLADEGFLDSIWSNRYVEGSGWGNAEALEVAEGDASQPQVAVNSSGNAIAVWTQVDDMGINGIWSNAYVSGNGWTGSVRVVWDASTHAGDPQVAINDDGVAFAVWNQQDNSPDGITHIWARVYIPGFGWDFIERIESAVSEFHYHDETDR